MQRLSVFALACLATLTLGLPALAEGRTKRGHHKPAHARQSRVDRDRDGLTNSFERHRSHTRPNRRDTDRDGLTDGYEVRRSRTNPRRRDTDGDGLSDRYEVRVSHTDPRRKDAPVHTPPDTPIDDGSSPSSPASPPPPPPPPPPARDTTPPQTTIEAGPSGGSASGSASFAFSASEPSSSFRCRLDGGAWTDCVSPKAYSGLADGSHTFDVVATDPAGNTDSSPASRTWTVVVLGSPSPGTNCMADPSSCGYPDVESTGVRAGASLTPVRGTVTLGTPGMVYENKLVTGSIVVTAPNVTIRNVKLVATDDSYGVQAFGWQHNTNGLLLDHVEIDLNGHLDIKGIAFDGYTLRNAFIHNGSDCAHFGDDVVIQDSLCVSGPDVDDDAWPDSTSFCHGTEHFDGLQSDGGANIVIRHNTVRNPCSQTSAILMSTNTSPIRNVTIEDNLLGGGGYTLYCDAGPDVPDETIAGNRFARTWYRGSGYWGAWTGCEGADVFSGNVWDDTGLALERG